MIKKDFIKIISYIKDLIKGSIYENNTYAVGGSVRDLVMGYDIKDIDLVISLKDGGISFAEYLKAKGYINGKIIIYPNFGTVKFRLSKFKDFEIEAVQTRQEEYLDKSSRKPLTRFGKIEDDALRRDLTINSLYYDISNTRILDPTKMGIMDIKNKIIRVTNTNPDIIFDEDPLRILRVIRFSSRYGWKIEDKTLKSMYNNVNRLNIISKERVNNEFLKMLICNHADMAIKLLKKSGAIKYVLPDLINLNINFNIDVIPKDISLRIAALLYPIVYNNIHKDIIEFEKVKNIVDVILRPLKITNEVINNVSLYISMINFINDSNNINQIRRMQFKINNKDIFNNICLLISIFKCNNFAENIIINSNNEIKNKTDMFNYKLPFNGFDIINNIKVNNNKVGEIKEFLIEECIKNPKITKEECIAILIKKYQ